MRAAVEAYRVPGESDLSLAGRGGIGPKALYSWLNGKHRPRETTWERVTARWKASKHLADPFSVPPDTVTAEVDTAPQNIASGLPPLTSPVHDPVSTPGEGKQEGHTVRHENATMAFGLVLGMRSEDEQQAALEFLREWGRGKAVPQPAAGRAQSRRRRK